MTSTQGIATRLCVEASLVVAAAACLNAAVSLVLLWRTDAATGPWEMCEGCTVSAEGREVHWVAAFHDGQAVSAASVQWMPGEPANPPDSHLAAPTTRADSVAARLAGMQLDQPPAVYSPGTFDTASSFVVAAGWPMRSFSRMTSASMSKGGIAVPVLHGWRSLRVLGSGAAVNTALYSAVIGVSLLGARRLRRWRRERQARCAACGFPRGLSAICTECGAVVPPANGRGRSDHSGG